MKRFTPYFFGLFSLLLLFWALTAPPPDVGQPITGAVKSERDGWKELAKASKKLPQPQPQPKPTVTPETIVREINNSMAIVKIVPGGNGQLEFDNEYTFSQGDPIYEKGDWNVRGSSGGSVGWLYGTNPNGFDLTKNGNITVPISATSLTG